jgi:hypothetical protein
MIAKDPIVEEVRATREKLFDACNGDLDAFLKYLKAQEQQDRSRLVSRKDVKRGHKRDRRLGTRPDKVADSKSVRARES